VKEAQAPGAENQGRRGRIGPPARGWIGRVELRRDIVNGCNKATPMKEVAKATEDAILRDKGTAGFST
jgi:hypothetical protein